VISTAAPGTTDSCAAKPYDDAIRLLPAAAWHGSDRSSQEARLADCSGLASDAAACQLALGRVDLAVETLEQGRSILWAQMLQLRNRDDALWRAQPDIATRLRDIAAALAAADEQRSSASDVSRAIDLRMDLASEWDHLVEKVRELDGFEGFLRLPALGDLLSAAADGPVVVVNVSRWRCDALIVTATGVVVCELPQLTASDVARQTNSYIEAMRSVDDVLSLEQSLSEVLGWLWDAIAAPVLSKLGFDAPADLDQSLPRLWWCPTGLLILLPLHAAGYHTAEGRAERLSVLDRVVSSYTPTLRALGDARGARTHSVDRGSGKGATGPPIPTDSRDAERMLIVAVPDPPGWEPLDAVARERRLLAELFVTGSP
jgi:hypothetical protein